MEDKFVRKQNSLQGVKTLIFKFNFLDSCLDYSNPTSAYGQDHDHYDHPDVEKKNKSQHVN